MSLVDTYNRIIEARLTEMKEAGIEWSAERQTIYNNACLRFYQASVAGDQVEMKTALKIVRQLEAEGGIL